MSAIPVRRRASSVSKWARVDRSDHRHQFTDTQVLDELTCLEHPTDRAGLDGLGWRLAEDRHASPIGPRESEQHVDRRRLARPVGTEQSDGLACGDGQVDPPHGMDLAIGLGKSVKAYAFSLTVVGSHGSILPKMALSAQCVGSQIGSDICHH